MAQSVSSPGAEAMVLLQGHLLDSLTLSKVMDLIQTHGADYRFNNIQVGHLKKDISSVNLTIQAAGQEPLQALLAELKPYGVQSVNAESDEAELAAVTVAGHPPEAALLLPKPERVKVGGAWLPVEASAHVRVLVVEAGAKTAVLRSPEELKVGDQVVVGAKGLQWP